MRIQKDTLCKECKIYRVTCVGYHKDGTQKFASRCHSCRRKRYNLPISNLIERYTLVRGIVCDRCEFIPEDLCQLDVDHIDGDHANDNPENLQTLCANCHRLKTKCDRENQARLRLMVS